MAQDTKVIAFGSSRLLSMYIRAGNPQVFDYCVDNYSKNPDIEGIPIVGPEALEAEVSGSFFIVVFAVSSASLVQICSQLRGMGLRYKTDFVLCSDFMHDDFVAKFEKDMGWYPSDDLNKFAVSFTLNSRRIAHTTLMGTWLFLEVMQKTADLRGAIAEVGGFDGANALCALSYATARGLSPRKYYLFDSFEGFPEPSEKDADWMKKGSYPPASTFEEVADSLAIFDEAVVLPGFVPGTFAEIPSEQRFSIVFYDCDLYQTALDTFNYFWDKLEIGGYMLVGDYETEPDGTPGVKLATDEFFNERGLSVFSIPQTTIGVIRKDS